MLHDSDDIATMTIEPEEIYYLVQKMAEHRQEHGEANFFTSIGILAERYRDDPDRTFCISQRMSCLIPLMNDPRMRGWSFEDSKDSKCTVTNAAVFIAVAKCSFLKRDESLSFDPDQFFKIVLENSDLNENT
jgi:hypothetical protein